MSDGVLIGLGCVSILEGGAEGAPDISLVSITASPLKISSLDEIIRPRPSHNSQGPARCLGLVLLTFHNNTC